jgi:2Fe-2S ferredoxin
MKGYAKVVYIGADERPMEIEVDVGTSLMRAAVDYGVHGIAGICGGILSCATCHVYVDEAFRERLPPPRADELEMLNCTAAARRENSRLSCQIVMEQGLDGIIVRIADPQT